MGSIYFNGTELTGVHDVNFNGTAMDNVYLNGTKLWTKHPYTPGTELFTFSWGACSGGGSNCGMVTHSNNFPLAFASISGCGSNDHTLTFTLNSGFYVSYYNQSQHGTQNPSASNTGGSYSVWVGESVSGLSGTGLSGGASGNCGSTLKVSYSGQ
tara:strand:- start:6 stop:470 length:465 start_codon:yes stop_codon:yes gene_type:complete